MSKNTDLANFDTNLSVANLTATGTISVGSITINSYGTTTNTFQVGTSSYFVSNGNVGIGTSSPSGTLDVRGNGSYYFGSVSNPRFRLLNSGGTSSTLISGADSGVVWFGSESNSDIYIISNNTERMRITSGGNVGIGTASPSGKLDVNGQLRSTQLVLTTAGTNYITAAGTGAQFVFQVNSATFAAIIDSTGNVGIGNSSPGDKLVVAGNVTPSASNTYDLGSSTLRWRNIYTNDLNLNNGIGDYTVVEGENDLYLYNNKKGKVYKFALIEVDPSEAPKKAQ